MLLGLQIEVKADPFQPNHQHVRETITEGPKTTMGGAGGGEGKSLALFAV